MKTKIPGSLVVGKRNLNHPLDLSTKVYEVDINKCVNSHGLSFGNSDAGWHYYVQALEEYKINRSISYDDSVLKRFFDIDFTGVSVADFFDLNPSQGLNSDILQRFPVRSEFPRPWACPSFNLLAYLTGRSQRKFEDGIISDIINRIKHSEASDKRITDEKTVQLLVRWSKHKTNEYINLSRDQTTQAFTEIDDEKIYIIWPPNTTHRLGFNSNQYGKDRFERIIKNYEHIKSVGYYPSMYPDGYIEGMFLVRDDDYRFIIWEGAHRLASLSALGHKKAQVKLGGGMRTIGKTGAAKYYYSPVSNIKDAVVNIKDIKKWPLVKTGYYNQESAKALFNAYFDKSFKSIEEIEERFA